MVRGEEGVRMDSRKGWYDGVKANGFKQQSRFCRTLTAYDGYLYDSNGLTLYSL
jgi:hypothetical protein